MQSPGDDISKINYSFGARLLHRLALGIPWVTRASFDLDRLLSKETQDLTSRTHVFISGLARAGTTTLMQAFYGTGIFRSLTYRDMPFVLMPRIWRQVVNMSPKMGTLEERSHRDGITIDFDSPEALEEVFWRIYLGRDYILAEKLVPHIVDEESILRFQSYVYRILCSASDERQVRYLSKNNNNILRLGAIQTAFPRALIIIPFRCPIQQSASLLEQHQQFSQRHLRDKFSCSYMRWLGHHEFGLTHKLFQFSPSEDNNLAVTEPGDINYWLTLWINTYSYLLQSAPDSCVFSCYEELCRDSSQLLKIFELANIDLDSRMTEFEFRFPRKRTMPIPDKELIERAIAIYKEMRRRADNELN